MTPLLLVIIALVGLVLVAALRHLRPDESQQFSQALQWLRESDKQIDIFEFVLQKIVRRHLALQLGKLVHPPCKTTRSNRSYGIVTSCSRRWRNVSSSDTGEVAKAFRTGAPHLRAKADGLQHLRREDCGFEQLGTALDRLALAVPQIKKNLIQACMSSVRTA